MKVKFRFLVCSMLALLAGNAAYAGDPTVQQDAKALQQVHSELELRVKERTAQLAQVNEDLRREIAIVTQEPILFNDSVRNNIAYGKPSATDREIIDAGYKG